MTIQSLLLYVDTYTYTYTRTHKHTIELNFIQISRAARLGTLPPHTLPLLAGVTIMTEPCIFPQNTTPNHYQHQADVCACMRVDIATIIYHT